MVLSAPCQQTKQLDSEVIPTVSLCELVRNQNPYAEKEVRVRATWQYGFEWSFLYDRECMDRDNKVWAEYADEDSLCPLTKKSLKRLKKRRFDNKADVVVVGKFYSGDHYGHMNGYQYQFIVSCVEKAESIPTNVP